MLLRGLALMLLRGLALLLCRGLALLLCRGLALLLLRGLACRLHLIPVYRASLLSWGLCRGCPLGVRRPLAFLLMRPLPILLTRFRPILLRRDGGRSGGRRLFVLPYLRIARLVAVILVVNIALLLHLMGIAIPGILALVGRQRCWRRRRTTVPPVPSAALLRPVIAPVIAPAWRRILLPTAEIGRRRPVVAHRDAQDEQRHRLRTDESPRSVVPGTRVPVVSLVKPVHAIVEEEIRTHFRRIVDRVAGDPDEVRVNREIDADTDPGKSDADADLGKGRSRRQEQRPQERDHIAHFIFLISFTGFQGLSLESDTPPNSNQPDVGCGSIVIWTGASIRSLPHTGKTSSWPGLPTHSVAEWPTRWPLRT